MFFFWGILAALISFALSFWLRSFSLKRNIAMARVRDRDVHATPTPRLGGVAIVGSFLIVMILIAIFAGRQASDFGFPFAVYGLSIDKRLLGILLASVFISLVMLKDDLKSVPAIWKFLSQIAAGLILIVSGIGIVYLNNPFGLAINLDTVKIPVQIGASVYHLVFWADLLLLIWVSLIMNATNFIDGLDGLAGAISLISGLILLVLSLSVSQGATALLAAVFVGAIIGFLPFNLPKAKLFLGDTGSMFLGLMLAVLSLISGGKLATLLLVFGLVILNALYVVVKRTIQGLNPMTNPDQTHLHHRFLQAGFSPTSTLILISSFSLAFGLAGILTGGQLKIYLVVALAIISILMFVVLDLRAKKTAV